MKYTLSVNANEYTNFFADILWNTFFKLNLENNDFYTIDDYNVDLLKIYNTHHIQLYADNLNW